MLYCCVFVLAIDYLGESGIGSTFTSPSVPYYAGNGDPWNVHSGNCGDLDIIGQQKPQSLYRNVLWNVSDMEILVHRPIEWNQEEAVSGWGWPDEQPSWTWASTAEGHWIQIRVFVSTCDGDVALYVNGVEVSDSPQPATYGTEFIATFNTTYTPGNVTATCVSTPELTKTLQSSGAAHSLRLTPDRKHGLQATEDDLAYVLLEVVDANGRLVSEFGDVDVAFELQFGGDDSAVNAFRLAAVANGDPTDISSVSQNTTRSWRGKAMAVVQPTPSLSSNKGKAKQLGGDSVTLRAYCPNDASILPAVVAISTGVM